MSDHYQLTDPEFEKQFASLSLEPSMFTHDAHLRLAWIHIRKYGPTQAIDNVTSQIKAFASHHGDHNKYHETITIAAVRAVYHFFLKSSSDNFPDFISEFPRLRTNFKALLNTHYSDIFAAEEARETFVEPDLEPFDVLIS